MPGASLVQLQWTVVVVVLFRFTAVLVMVESALASYSRAHAQELVNNGRAGAKRLLVLLEDPPRFTATLTLLRISCEISGYVILSNLLMVRFEMGFGQTILTVLLLAVLISFVIINVGVRTLGRQHSDAIALGSAGSVSLVSRFFRRLTSLLVLLGTAITPGRGFA